MNKKLFGKFCILILLLSVCVIVLCGCESSASNEELLKTKNLEEVEFLNNRILNISNDYYLNEYVIDNGGIDLEKISSDFKIIEDSISVIVLDMTSLGIDSSIILDFERDTQYCRSAISNQNINDFLYNLSNLYSKLYKILDESSQEENLIKSYEIRSDVLYATVFSEISDFEKSLEYANDAINKYNELIQNEEFLSKNYYKANKTEVELQEFKLAIENKSVDTIKSKDIDIMKEF
jgi:hypothetical protein